MPFFGAPAADNGQQPQPSVAPSAPSIFHTSSKASPATVIAKGVRLEGQFKSQGDVLIEGEVQGTIQTDGLLTVGADAFVKATVTAADAVVAGKVEGNVLAKRRLEVKSTARVNGDIVCETIIVEAGAALKGNLTSGSKTDAKPEPKTEAPSNDPQKTTTPPADAAKADAANKT